MHVKMRICFRYTASITDLMNKYSFLSIEFGEPIDTLNVVQILVNYYSLHKNSQKVITDNMQT